MRFNKILVIIQRSNGDVLLSSSLIEQLQENFQPKEIDLLVNDDTLSVAKTLPNIHQISPPEKVNITFLREALLTSPWPKR